MIVSSAEQGSPEWFADRAGVITASMFAECRKRANGLTEQQAKYVAAMLAGQEKADAMKEAGYSRAPAGEKIERALAGEKVGDFTEAARNYAFRLAVERLSGEALYEDQFEGWAARRGKELEPEARNLHSFIIGKDIEQVGLITTDDRRFGASADGLIEEDGGSEYKCFLSPEKLRAILVDGDISAEIMDQVQGGMWISGRKWWHFVLYCPVLASVGKECIVHPVDRDEAYIKALEADLQEFDKLVCHYMDTLRESPRKAA